MADTSGREVGRGSGRTADLAEAVARRLVTARLCSGQSSPHAPKRLELLRAIRQLGRLKRSHSVGAATVVGTALRLWCDRAYRGLGSARLRVSPRLRAARSLVRFVDLLTRLPLLEGAYWLSTAYSALSAESYRKTLAMFFTPPRIADRLISDLESEGVCFSRDRFLDPACGGAAFVALIAWRMRQELLASGRTSREVLEHAETHLSGVDLDPTLCALSRHFLRMVFHAEIRATRYQPTWDVMCADSLECFRNRDRHYDVVISNPPFRKLSADQALEYRADFAEVMHAQPNLYALFISLSVRLAKLGGVVGLVTPTSFLSGQYFANVRTFLLKNTRVRHIGLVYERERVYLDVEQETALTVLRADAPRAHGARPVVSVVERDGQYVRVGRCPLPNSGTSWPLARDASDLELLRNATRSPYRLADYGFRPFVGGFVWTRDTRPVYMTWRDVPRARRDTAVPLLWATDVRPDGTLRYDPHRALFEQHRFVDFGREHASVRRRPGILMQRVTSGDQAKRLIGAVVSPAFIARHGGYVGENHTVTLEHVADRGFSPEEMLSVVAAPAVERYFRCISGSPNVSIFELQQLPLPEPKRLRSMMSSGISAEDAATRLLYEDD